MGVCVGECVRECVGVGVVCVCGCVVCGWCGGEWVCVWGVCESVVWESVGCGVWVCERAVWVVVCVV